MRRSSLALSLLLLPACLFAVASCGSGATTDQPHGGAGGTGGTGGAGTCTEGAVACDGATPQTCVKGGWVASSACDGATPACLEGQCVACAPGEKACESESIPKTCDASGTWVASAACAQPAPDCRAGECTCAPEHTLCGSACVDLKSSKDHCGACDHPCGGGDCVSGVCQPLALASGQERPAALTVDGTHVYFSNSKAGGLNNAVARVPKAGGAVEVLAADQKRPHGIAVNANAVYWANSDLSNITRQQIAPTLGMPEKIALGTVAPIGLAIDATNVYWAAGGSNMSKGVFRTPLDATSATPPVSLAIGSAVKSTIAVALDGPYVYFTNAFYDVDPQPSSLSNVSRVLSAGNADQTAEVVVTNQPKILGVALDAKNVYFTANQGSGADKVLSCLKSAVPCNSPVVLADDLDMIDSETSHQQFFSDGTHVYWGNSGAGTIMRVPVEGGLKETLYTNQKGANAVVTDGTYLYWVTATSVVRGVKSPKVP